MPTKVPANYTLYNSQVTKRLAVAVVIDGLSDILSSMPLYERLRYGDPIDFADPGLLYGGLRPVPGVKDYLSLDGSSLTISQRLEPEQGRAAISTVSLSFIDKDGYMTALCSPGVVLDDILGKSISISIGYAEISYPEDYFIVFRGLISGVQIASGMCVLTISDPNIVRKQKVFYTAKTKTTGALTSGDTTVNLIANGDFHKSILGPNGSYDSGVKTYMKIEDEFIEYGPSASLPSATFGTNTFTGCTRGARGTIAVAHAPGVDVEARLELSGGVIDMALKLMLSGWGAAWKSSIPIYSIVKSTDLTLGDIPGIIVLPTKVDAVRDYGLAVGDYITISGASVGGNNITCRVQRLDYLFYEPNRIIYTDGALVHEYPTSATFAIRSQYDVYPSTCGVKMKGSDVDIANHVNLKNQFLGTAEYSVRFLLDSEQTCKTFIESELFLPFAAYSLTKTGRLSVGLTKPPIADETLVFLDKDNIIDPQNLKPRRDLNTSRKFFNEISYEWDALDNGNLTTTSRYLDSDSISIIGISSVLPIKSLGARTDLGFANVVDRNAKNLLTRYKRGATIIDVKVNWGVGSLIESGDIVGVIDGGHLQISNFATGKRDIGTQLFEVVDRSLSIKDGNVALKLISGLGTNITDRFATIAPSSLVSTGSTTSEIIIQDSYGALYPGNEKLKWADYVGLPIIIHSYDWSVQGSTTIIGFDPVNPYKMLVSPALGFSPLAGYSVEIDNYPTSTDASVNQMYKNVHAYLGYSLSVVTGISTTQFTVSPTDIAKFLPGGTVRIHNAAYTIDSGTDTDHFVLTADSGTNTVTLKTALTFTPATGQIIDLIGYADGGGAYRFV